MLKTKVLLSILFFTIIVFTLKAQSFVDDLETPVPNQGTVNIFQDYSIKKTSELFSYYKSKSYKGIRGFRINIFSDSGQGAKEDAIKARARFIDYFGNTDVNIQYDAPFWRVYAGKYLVKSDARRSLGKMSGQFPNAYIVPYYFDLPDE